MSKVGKVPGQAGWLARVTGRLVLLIGTAGGQLFQAEDADARHHGWQITARRGGLARTYRDPRFDSLHSCAICRGTGNGLADQACERCAGTGRITVVRQPLPDRGRGR
jgi:hypothetical protein